MPSQNSDRENVMCQPAKLCHPASTLRYNRYLPRRQIFRFLFLSLVSREAPYILLQMWRTLQAFFLFPPLLLGGWHARCGLPAIKTPPCAKKDAFAFPTAPHWPIDSQEWEDHDKIESNLCRCSK